MGVQKTIQAVSRVTTAASGLRKIEENFDKESGMTLPSTEHSYVSAEKDLNDMISIECGLKPFQEIPGQHHVTLPRLPRSPFDLVDIRILQEWMKTSKEQLVRDSDTPWDESGEDSASLIMKMMRPLNIEMLKLL